MSQLIAVPASRSAINAGVGVCIALGISVILSALLYLSLRRRRHLRRIQAQEQREADAAVIEEAKHSASASRGSPVLPPVTAREWLVSDERAWRAELRKELEADVRQLKREEKARDKDSILMVEDINKLWKGKMKVTS